MDKGAVKTYLMYIGMTFCALAITYIAALFILGAGSMILSSTNTESYGGLSWSMRNDTGEIFPQVFLNDDGNLSGSFTFESPDDILLLALVDYNVTPFYYNGSHGIAHNILATPGEWRTNNNSGRFRITGIPEGYHAIDFIAITNPYLNDSGSTRTYGSQMIVSQSLEVIVSSNTKPAPEFKGRSASDHAVYLPDRTGTNGLLTREPSSSNNLWKIAAKPGSFEEYYVNVPQRPVNNTIVNNSFAILQLLDYEQITVRDDTPDLVYYGWMNDSDSCSIHMSLKAPAEPGLHKITVLIIRDPYGSMEITPDMSNYDSGKGLFGDYLDLYVAR